MNKMEGKEKEKIVCFSVEQAKFFIKIISASISTDCVSSP